MTREKALNLQENLAKEAVAMLVIDRKAEIEPYERSIRLIGTACGLTQEDTGKSFDLIARERALLDQADEACSVEHVLPESELPMNASGCHTLDNVWGLFEAATLLNDPAGRAALYCMARTLEETQNLLDWIDKTPEEKQG